MLLIVCAIVIGSMAAFIAIDLIKGYDTIPLDFDMLASLREKIR